MFLEESSSLLIENELLKLEEYMDSCLLCEDNEQILNEANVFAQSLLLKALKTIKDFVDTEKFHEAHNLLSRCVKILSEKSKVNEFKSVIKSLAGRFHSAIYQIKTSTTYKKKCPKDCKKEFEENFDELGDIRVDLRHS